MASQKLFDNVPPFPSDVPTATMSTISLASLTSGDEASAKRVLDACQELGFFLLDLNGDVLGGILIGEIDELFGAMEKIMNLPEDVKAKYLHDIPRSFLGFKPRGAAKTETGEPDRFEWFNLGQDGLLGTTPPQPVPDLVLTYRALFISFLQHAQTIVSTLCQLLATQLSLPPSTFTALQCPSKPSGTVVRMIKAEPTPATEKPRTSMVHHTDFGTVTLLANVIGGLQILTPGKHHGDEGAWKWVRPRPGCLVVNLGDAMVEWTGGVLRSNVHRVNHAPGEQRFVERYSMALLVRPEKEARMERLMGGTRESGEKAMQGNAEPLVAWEWEVRKAMALRRGDDVMQSKGGKALEDISFREKA